ncbi:MAG: amylo-alpha-1,6-glucosidase [Oscillospiraceae bacterium]|nr:amylo-alpha-1,6-glucosidase [Oscillospiraceae bacterium]
MRFVFGKQDMTTLEQAQERCWLLANGLGGYMSASAAFSVTRCDQGLLVAAEAAPNQRVNLVHRLSEELTVGGKREFLSTQTFADGREPEEGYRNLSSFLWDRGPVWLYHVDGVQIRRRCAMACGSNRAAVVYEIENRSAAPCALRVRPFCLFAPKGQALVEKCAPHWENNALTAGGYTLYISTDGALTPVPPVWETPAYPDDARDGRTAESLAAACCEIETVVPAGEAGTLEAVFSTEPGGGSGDALLAAQRDRMESLAARRSFRDPAARQLAQSADAFITRRDSTNGMTIVAGYPFFGDWGRDTMIALPGCLLSTGRFEEAKSVLRTFLAYERDGLVPNLFPEGQEEPRYNTADAALLLINCVWLYYRKTGDAAFVRGAWPVMARIIRAYLRGTRHAIGADADGLVHAGEGLDQVTWMDVCINGVLPTPRHGKPVELNAYWYNALRIMGELAPLAGEAGREYAALAERVRESFNRKFWLEEEGYLRDVLSGSAADTQMRCNQIWAVSMPFTMLSPRRERQVVDAVYRRLYTPCGLRTLAPDDREFHPVYAGPQPARDMAYHQGTVWPFPLGAYYLAYLKTRGDAPEAARAVREQLEPMEAMLREGCVGFLPEIYDGGNPGASKGCFAQAWSVGELLRVYEKLEEIEADGHAG